MKTSSLLIGLGVGLLVGAATAAYFVSSDEQKQALVDDVNDVVHKAKRSIKKAVNAGIEELDEAADKVSNVAKTAVERVKANNA